MRKSRKEVRGGQARQASQGFAVRESRGGNVGKRGRSSVGANGSHQKTSWHLRFPSVLESPQGASGARVWSSAIAFQKGMQTCALPKEREQRPVWWNKEHLG